MGSGHVTHVHDALKDAVHHDVLQHHVLTDVVSGCQDYEQETKTEVLKTGCNSTNRETGVSSECM